MTIATDAEEEPWTPLPRAARFSIRRCVRSCAYLNNVVEQDHRRVKRRVNPMLGFKSFENARVVIAGMELAQKISKRPCDLRRLGGTDASHAHVWQRVRAA
jgi:transposase-like protein